MFTAQTPIPVPIVFVGGIYGSGKTTVVRSVAGQLGAAAHSASRLAEHVGLGEADASKAVRNVEGNQERLVRNLRAAVHKERRLGLLDGHFCIFNHKLEIEEVAINVFRAINVRACVLVECDPHVALERLKHRDGDQYSHTRLAELAIRESAHATSVCDALAVPLIRCDSKIDQASLARMIRNALDGVVL